MKYDEHIHAPEEPFCANCGEEFDEDNPQSPEDPEVCASCFAENYDPDPEDYEAEEEDADDRRRSLGTDA